MERSIIIDGPASILKSPAIRKAIAAHDLTNAGFLDDALGNIVVQFTRQRSGEGVEERGECR
jgi:hypothetical protein